MRLVVQCTINFESSVWGNYSKNWERNTFDYTRDKLCWKASSSFSLTSALLRHLLLKKYATLLYFVGNYE